MLFRKDFLVNELMTRGMCSYKVTFKEVVSEEGLRLWCVGVIFNSDFVFVKAVHEKIISWNNQPT